MSESTIRVKTAPSQPIPAISRVQSCNLTVSVFTFNSLETPPLKWEGSTKKSIKMQKTRTESATFYNPTWFWKNAMFECNGNEKAL